MMPPKPIQPGSVEDLGQQYAKAAVERELQRGDDPLRLYDRLMGPVEEAVLRLVMEGCHGVQLQAASALRMNRTTLRTKLMEYGLI